MSPSRYPHLLKPFRLRHLTFKNRLMSTSHAPGYVEDRHPKLRYQLYHEEKARGGLALTMFGARRTSRPTRPPRSGRSTSATTRSYPCSGSSPSACTGTGAPSCARSRTWGTARSGTSRTGCRRWPPRWYGSTPTAPSPRRWTAATSGGWCGPSATPRCAAGRAASTAPSSSPTGISSTSSGRRSSTGARTSTEAASTTAPASGSRSWRKCAGGRETTSSSESG